MGGGPSCQVRRRWAERQVLRMRSRLWEKLESSETVKPALRHMSYFQVRSHCK